MFSLDAFRDLLPSDGECVGEETLLLSGGVGGTSPVSLTSESILLHSIFKAATGESTKMSRSSGSVPSSGGGDAIGGTTPGSVEGSGAAGRGGGGDASLDGFGDGVALCLASCSLGLPISATDTLWVIDERMILQNAMRDVDEVQGVVNHCGRLMDMPSQTSGALLRSKQGTGGRKKAMRMMERIKE